MENSIRQKTRPKEKKKRTKIWWKSKKGKTEDMAGTKGKYKKEKINPEEKRIYVKKKTAKEEEVCVCVCVSEGGRERERVCVCV